MLLVEDNEDDERLTLRALKQSYPPPRVEVARDGAEAISLLDRWPCDGPCERELPSLILLDLKLPKFTGHQVLEAYRAHEPTRDVPIVIVTSSENEMDIRALWKMGASDYMKKPVDYHEYISAIESVARMWLPQAVLA
ncbi:MAG: response regulator [Fimbriimonas sp.]